jgi:DMSO reductase anchor subunit
VQHQADECIGCQYCTWNCPYSVPVFQPDRRIVTKCDLCLPRLGEGLAPACVSACPTEAIKVEPVDVEAWRADHASANAPNLPSASITLSTTHIKLPDDVPLDTFAASDHRIRPEHPHWPLIVLTLLTQMAVGSSLAGARATAAVVAIAALAGSIAHLGRPLHAWKALRNLRRSWLSREVALLGAYALAAPIAFVAPVTQPVSIALGVAGITASALLYIVPGRPSWNTPLTLLQFWLTATCAATILAGRPLLAALAMTLQLGTFVANLVRLHLRHDVEARGTVRLTLDWFRPLFAARVVALIGGAALAIAGHLELAAAVVAPGELAGRYLFYVTVVPLNMPGSFWRDGR